MSNDAHPVADASPLQVGPVPTTFEQLMTDYGNLVGDVVAFLVAFVVVYLLGRLVAVPLAKRAMERSGFDPAVRSLADDVLAALVFTVAAVAAFSAAVPSFLTAFAALGGALALALGFAADDLLGNFVAGVFILRDKPFTVGDWIEWSEGEGRVEDIDLRVTRVRTFDNELVTVPNGDLANDAVKNPVAYDTLRQQFLFGIGYGDDIGQATDLILEEASEHDDILDDPGTSVRLTELGDSAVGLQARFWIADPKRSDVVKTRSEFVRSVKERFDDAGIDMPYPYRQLTGDIDVAVDGELRTTESTTPADD